MIHELHEKIKLEFRVREILSGLWELEWVLYMVGFVLKNATTLMLCVFALEHVCRIWHCVHGAHVSVQEVEDEVSGLGLVLVLFLTPPFYWLHPLAHFFIFLYFCIYFSFLILFYYFPNIKNTKNIFINFHIYFCILFYFSNIKLI